METLTDIDWGSVFALSLPWLEIVIRGSAIYWFIFLIFRFLIRREVGSVGIADILILVLVADASQNGMAGEAHSIADSMVLIATLVGWNFLLDWLSFRFEFVRRFTEPSALCLVRNGRMQYRNMRQEFITEDELRSKLREAGVEDMSEVRHAYMESDGQFSVIKSRRPTPRKKVFRKQEPRK